MRWLMLSVYTARLLRSPRPLLSTPISYPWCTPNRRRRTPLYHWDWSSIPVSSPSRLDNYEDEEALFHRNLKREVKDDHLPPEFLSLSIVGHTFQIQTPPPFPMHRTLWNVVINPHKGFYVQEALSAITSSTITIIFAFEGYVRRFCGTTGLVALNWLALFLPFRNTRIQWDATRLSIVICEK